MPSSIAEGVVATHLKGCIGNSTFRRNENVFETKIINYEL